MRNENESVGGIGGDELRQLRRDRLRAADEGLPPGRLDDGLPDGQPLPLRLDVGLVFKKGTPPAPAFQAAVNGLKAEGTYDRILKKWGIGASAIKTSQISPPEIK